MPENFTQKCKAISDGLRDGVFEIVTEEDKIEIEKSKKEESNFKIVKRKERNPISEAEKNKKGSLDYPIEIDLSGSGKFKRDN